MEQEFLKKLNSVKQNIRMSESDKDFIRKNLLSEISKTNLPIPSYYRAKYLAISTFLIFGSAGVSFAAENTLPGDFLYPVKININEKVAASLKFDPAKRAEYEITLANRRLEEMQTLQKENKLDTETKNNLQTNYNQHTITAQEKIILSEQGEATILNANLQDSINSAKKVFEIEGNINANVEVQPEVKIPIKSKKNNKYFPALINSSSPIS